MSALGPRWSLKELRTFYILLKAHGQQWERLEERLPQRSGAMVRALFEMHRGYLSLPEASVEGFCAVMMDHYEALQQRAAANQRPRQDGGQDQDVDMEQDQVVKREAAPPQDGRSRKKRRLEKLLATEQLATLRIRAGENGHLTVSVDKRTPADAGSGKTAGRKSRTPQRARAWLPREEESDSTGLSKVRGARFDLPWCHWFYSYVDVDFFHHNEFIECLSGMGLGKVRDAWVCRGWRGGVIDACWSCFDRLQRQLDRSGPRCGPLWDGRGA
ncbi:unnamed protein product [Phytophthora lilii]|uniref:Unnamed protein product n=1 Tax=Phytophthora lilii TaxID=2077276 RepID=A0A9W6YHW7_9STRA|nr:unnamed protein product [Phytophthora lilii]